MAQTSRVGDQICGLVERLADGVPGSKESKSGEDMMAWMEEANGEMRSKAIQEEREWNREENGVEGGDDQPEQVRICVDIIKGIIDATLTGDRELRGRTMERSGAKVRREEDVEEGGKGPNGGEVIVGSCDVKALYPSLKKKECAEVVGRLVRETKMEIVGVNYEEVGVAISMMA